MAEFLSLAAAKAHLNEDGNDTIDDELQGFIDAAVEVVEAQTGEVVVARDLEETVRLDYPCAGLLLDRTPVLALTEVTSLDGATAWDVDALAVDPATGRVDVLHGRPLHGALRIRYRAGREDGWPARQVMAAKMLVLHWWQTQRTSYGGTTRYGGAQDDGVEIVGSYAVPRAVLELLGPRGPLVG